MLRRRMPIWTEIRWSIAATMLGWVLTLTQREASAEALEAIADLAMKLQPDPRHETEWMRSKG